ncbi:MAG: hypothetical protein V2I43_15675, partial [Parvularcula sp.]|nr:hypothetical protein [Parvularcula sp.]
MKKKIAFQPTRPEPREARAVTIELRDGRRLSGVLSLPKRETSATFIGRAQPFLTIRTSRGDLSINRAEIVAILMRDVEEGEPTAQSVPNRQD